MFNSYLIEVAGKTAGILARDERGYRFHATAQPFFSLDGRIFADPWVAHRAARREVARGRPARADQPDA